METSKSGLHALPEATRKLFENIRNAPGIENFILVGGTALALRLGHRYSEDLDFLTTRKIDPNEIIRILNHVHAQDREQKFKQVQNPTVALEFDMEGANFEEYSQNWRVNDVKLQFFTKRIHNAQAQSEFEARMQTAPVPGLDQGRIQVATEKFIFSTKSQVLSERLVTRDLFDLKTLLLTGRYDLDQLFSECAALGSNPDLIREKIVNGRMATVDPTVDLIDGGVATTESVRAWFEEQINEYERKKASQSLGK